MRIQIAYMMSTSIIKWLNCRTDGTWMKKKKKLKPQLSFDTIDRLFVERILLPHSQIEKEYHNRPEWSRSGTILASTHEDGIITLWDPFKAARKHTFDTGWREKELYSLKFIPSNERLIVISPRNIVKVMDIEVGSNIIECDACLYNDKCYHLDAITTHPNEPFIIWSSDSKCIRQYDIRERHVCRQNNQQNVILHPVDCITALTMHPTRSEILALGSDIYVKLFDRRFSCNTTNGPRHTTSFAPGFLPEYSDTDAFDVKNLEFNFDGSELLVSYWNFGLKFYMYRTFEPWEPYRSFETSLEPLTHNKPSEISPHDANLKPYCLWNDLSNQESIELPTEHEDFYDDITRKIRAKENLMKGDYDKVNRLLTDYKNCAELYLLRSDLLLLRDWGCDDYQALRDLCCAISLKPSIRSFDTDLEDEFSKWRSGVTSTNFVKELNYFDFVKRFDEEGESMSLGFFGYQDEFIISGACGRISIYDKATTNLLKSFKLEPQFNGYLSIHPNSCIFACSFSDGRILLMSLEGGDWKFPNTDSCKPDYEYSNTVWTGEDAEFSYW